VPTEQVDGYADLVEIGRGGDSIVYRARELALHRLVAIKVLLVDDEERAVRFAREIEITLDLGRQHPNIVTVLAVATTRSGRPAIVMDHHEGGTLHDRLQSHGPMPVEEVVRVGEVLADALDFAHRRGVLHRDVKPQNVLVLPTSWVLADFGIARLADSEHTSSAETFTYRHAAPQVLDGYAPTASDDVWSLGSTLFTLLDGRPPFASDDPHDDSALAYLRRARTEPHRRLVAPGAGRVAAVIDRCLAKDVESRWSSAAELRDALGALRGSAWEPAADPASPPLGATARPRGPAPVAEPTAAPGDRSFAPPVHPAGAPGHEPAVDATARRAPAHRRDDTPAAVAAPPPLSQAPLPPRPDPVLAPEPDPPARPAEPVPVALSIAGRAPERVDAEATGLGHATGAFPRVADDPARDDAPVKGRRRRLPLVLLATALVVGLVLGLGGAVLRRVADGDDTQSVGEVAVDPVPSLTAEPTEAPTLRDRPSKDLAFVITDIRARPDGLYLAWRPVDDEDVETYTVFQMSPEEKLVATLPAESREYEVPISVPAGRSCYRMTVFTITGEYGLAKQRCVTR
jgi:serine/threonine protein kinase